MITPKDEHGDDKDYYYDSYKEFAWKFRLWLVAYGASIPFVVLTNDKMRALVINAPNGTCLLKMALIGVLIQVLLTWAYKSCMWYCDRHAKGALPAWSWKYKAAAWFSEKYSVEIAADAVSLLLFSVSTFQLLGIVAPSPAT